MTHAAGLVPDPTVRYRPDDGPLAGVSGGRSSGIGGSGGNRRSSSGGGGAGRITTGRSDRGETVEQPNQSGIEIATSSTRHAVDAFIGGPLCGVELSLSFGGLRGETVRENAPLFPQRGRLPFRLDGAGFENSCFRFAFQIPLRVPAGAARGVQPPQRADDDDRPDDGEQVTKLQPEHHPTPNSASTNSAVITAAVITHPRA